MAKIEETFWRPAYFALFELTPEKGSNGNINTGGGGGGRVVVNGEGESTPHHGYQGEGFGGGAGGFDDAFGLPECVILELQNSMLFQEVFKKHY